MAKKKSLIKTLEPPQENQLSEYDIDSMWMSYRYCIGRHTIASHMRAGDIVSHCYGKLSKDRSEFTAFDIDREIEQSLRCIRGVNFWFPSWNTTRVVVSAIDCFCEFVTQYNITTIEELLSYKDVHINYVFDQELYAYKPEFDTVKWEEEAQEEARKNYKVPNPDYFSMSDIEDLMVWNDVVHVFDYRNHHKCKLIDGTECVYFWTWTRKYSEDRTKQILYRKIRVPLDKWNGSVTTWIPDDAVESEIY